MLVFVCVFVCLLAAAVAALHPGQYRPAHGALLTFQPSFVYSQVRLVKQRFGSRQAVAYGCRRVCQGGVRSVSGVS